MARFIFPVGGTAESVRAQLGAVGPAPDPTTYPPGIGDVLTWNGAAWVPGAGGGGGGTVIADGGTLSGTYTSDVLCVGNVSLAGNVTIKGKLIIENTLTNPDGYELTVLGDLFGRYFSLTRSDTSQVGGNISVDGDFWFYWIEFHQSGGTAATLRVGGDLIGSAGFIGSYINAYGLDDTPGANLYVYGDLIAGYIDLDGGSSVAGNAGQGGTLVVWGDLTLTEDISFKGGDASGFNAGNGGYVEVYGDMNVNEAYGYGGDATDGNAGNGGTLEVVGSMTSGGVQIYGGECTSDNEAFFSGQGGNIYIDGNLSVDSYMNLNGGDRKGNLSAPALNQPPNAGNLRVRGNVAFDGDFDAEGGSLYQTGASIGQAGRGGNIDVQGNACFDDDIDLGGGYAEYGDAGDGGSLDCWGSLQVEDDIDLNGGYALNGNGGGGGSLNVGGDATVDSASANGGYSANGGNGGNGGLVFIEGDYVAGSSLDLQGGGCGSTNEVHYASNGGSIFVDGNFVSDSSLYLRGGDRSGATTIAGANGPANAGSFSCDGNAVLDYIYGNGGNVSTNFPNAPGGNGAYISVSGSLKSRIEIYGGNSVGANGGQGGTMYVRGGAVLFDLNANGGNSDDSVGVGGDAAVNGAASPILEFPAGLVSNQFSLLDGGGAGSAPMNNVDLYLGHFCTLGYFNATDRAEVRVRSATADLQAGYGYLDCTLKVANLPSKQTLNNNDGTATGNVGPLPIGTLFIAGGGVWHAVVGAAI